ncbi:hypothetical protein ACJ5H2_05935 [Nocardioides sp. R1-1]|uniref:hypothetical protein n=1 Tax=Nocardioides sp. R1-1 TaxID=3383502 RepID=UPI0038CF87E7
MTESTDQTPPPDPAPAPATTSSEAKRYAAYDKTFKRFVGGGTHDNRKAAARPPATARSRTSRSGRSDMPLPTGEPTSREEIKAWAKITDSKDDTVLDDVAAAVNDLVRGLPVAQRSNADPAPEEWPAQVKFGATLLGARLFRRRNTPGGVEASGAFGIAYVRRNDPDVAQMLELGEYSRPAVG